MLYVVMKGIKTRQKLSRPIYKYATKSSIISLCTFLSNVVVLMLNYVSNAENVNTIKSERKQKSFKRYIRGVYVRGGPLEL